MATTTIKVASSVRDSLNRLAKLRGVSVNSVIEELPAEGERARRFADLRAAIAASGPGETAYREETSGWEASAPQWPDE